jgi:hypothetical protein
LINRAVSLIKPPETLIKSTLRPVKALIIRAKRHGGSRP